MGPRLRFQLFLAALGLAALLGCDIIGGHGNVDVTNGTGQALTRVQLVYESGDEEGGALAAGGVVHFTGIPAGSVTVYGYNATNSVAIASVGGALSDGQTISLTLVGF